MGRAIDHIVVPCRDLAAAALEFERLGFQVGRRNRHPWGTENHVIQFPGAFIELIAPAPDAVPPLSQDDAFPFAGFLAGRASSTDPSGMLVLRSDDARADAQDFAARGIGTRRTLDFSREAATPEGGTRTVAFTLAFAEAATMPDIGFFVCQQHYPENFWNPAFQLHPNGAIRLAGVVIVAENPGAQAGFLAGFSGTAEAAVSNEGVSIETRGGLIEVITPGSFVARFGSKLPSRAVQSAMLGAIRFDTMDYAAIPRMAGEAGCDAVDPPRGLVLRLSDPNHPALVFGPEA